MRIKLLITYRLYNIHVINVLVWTNRFSIKMYSCFLNLLTLKYVLVHIVYNYYFYGVQKQLILGPSSHHTSDLQPPLSDTHAYQSNPFTRFPEYFLTIRLPTSFSVFRQGVFSFSFPALLCKVMSFCSSRRALPITTSSMMFVIGRVENFRYLKTVLIENNEMVKVIETDVSSNYSEYVRITNK